MSVPPPSRLPDPKPQYDARWAEGLQQILAKWFEEIWKKNHTVNGKLTTLNGRILKGVLVVDATYTIKLTDEVIDVNRAGAVALTLPEGADKWQRWYVQDSSGAASSNTITIAKSASKNVNGGASVTITTDYGRRMIVYNGAQFIAQ